MLDLRHIQHPRRMVPRDHIDQYLTYWLRRPLDKEVCNKLRVECPTTSVSHKVSHTPEFDTLMSNYMIKQGRDPRKGIKKGLKNVQDKLLDESGPLTQALVLTDEALSQGTALDPINPMGLGSALHLPSGQR